MIRGIGLGKVQGLDQKSGHKGWKSDVTWLHTGEWFSKIKFGGHCVFIAYAIPKIIKNLEIRAIARGPILGGFSYLYRLDKTAYVGTWHEEKKSFRSPVKHQISSTGFSVAKFWSHIKTYLNCISCGWLKTIGCMNRQNPISELKHC